MRRRRAALAAVIGALAAGGALLGGNAGAATSAATCAGRAPVVVRGRGDVQVFAVQFKQEVGEVSTYASIASYVDCYFRRYIVPYRDRSWRAACQVT